MLCFTTLTFPGGSVVKNPPANAGDVGSIPGLGRSAGEGNGSPLQYSCLGNPMNRGALAGYSPWGPKESDTTQQLNNNILKKTYLFPSYYKWEMLQHFRSYSESYKDQIITKQSPITHRGNYESQIGLKPGISPG